MVIRFTCVRACVTTKDRRETLFFFPLNGDLLLTILFLGTPICVLQKHLPYFVPSRCVRDSRSPCSPSPSPSPSPEIRRDGRPGPQVEDVDADLSGETRLRWGMAQR